MKKFLERLIKVLQAIGLIFGILGISFIGGIAKPIYYSLPFVYRGNFEKKVESIKPAQSYFYIKSILDEAQVSEKFDFPLKTGETEIGTRKIWANDLYTLIGYFRNDNSLFGYIMICQDINFKPKFGSDFYDKNGFGKLMQTNFIDAQEKSSCYIDTVKGFHADSALCSTYYMELYDFHRSDFCYGLAITNIGVDNNQIDENFYKVGLLPYYNFYETKDIEEPTKNELYQPFRKMKPNAMMLFDNRSNINCKSFIDKITEFGLGISYSDIRRLY